jgi:hypothetical protein
MTLTELNTLLLLLKRWLGAQMPLCMPGVLKAQRRLPVALWAQCQRDHRHAAGTKCIRQAGANVLEQAGDQRHRGAAGPAGERSRLVVIYHWPVLLLARQTITTLRKIPLICKRKLSSNCSKAAQQQIGCAILVVSPTPIWRLPLYKPRPFMAAVPVRIAKTRSTAAEIKEMLLLGNGHCSRPRAGVYLSSPGFPTSGGIQKRTEGSSLETIKHMVRC